MTAPESRPDIESVLADAFARRHDRQPSGRPSLIDVRHRARRQSSRRATVRASAVVTAGAAVVAGSWAATRGDSTPSAVPAVPAHQPAPPTTTAGVAVTTLSVDGLWDAVAAQLGTTVDELRTYNPGVDFAEAPVPGTPIASPGASVDAPTPTFIATIPPTTFAGPEITTTTLPAPATTHVLVATTTARMGTTTTTSTSAGIGADCVLSDAQIQALVEYVRSIPGPGDPPSATVTLPVQGIPANCMGLPPLPDGWTLYQIVAGDYVYEVAERFCTTAEEIVAGNEWAAGVNTPIQVGQLISVPADAC